MLMSLRSPWFFQLKKKSVVQHAVSMTLNISFLFIPSRQLELLSAKKGKLLAGQRRLKARWELNNPRKWSLWIQKAHTHTHTHTHQRVVIHKKSVSFTEFIEPTANAGISLFPSSTLCHHLSLPSDLFFCLRRILGAPGNFSFMRIKWRALHP